MFTICLYTFSVRLSGNRVWLLCRVSCGLGMTFCSFFSFGHWGHHDTQQWKYEGALNSQSWCEKIRLSTWLAICLPNYLRKPRPNYCEDSLPQISTTQSYLPVRHVDSRVSKESQAAKSSIPRCDGSVRPAPHLPVSVARKVPRWLWWCTYTVVSWAG